MNYADRPDHGTTYHTGQNGVVWKRRRVPSDPLL